jgi:hypothetical protein
VCFLSCFDFLLSLWERIEVRVLAAIVVALTPALSRWERVKDSE